MKVLITGGAGYLGYALVERLQAAGPASAITVYDNLSRRTYAFFGGAYARRVPMRFVRGELLDAQALARALDGVEAVVHLAARVTTPFADHEAHAFDQVNHWGTAQLVQAVRDSPSVQRFVYLSSASVYGSAEGPVTEATPPHPESFYGTAKLRGEEQLVRLPERVRAWTIRAGNLYGYNPAIRYDAVLNRFLFEAHFSGRITVHGSGDQRRPFLHVDKLADTLARLLDSEVPAGTWNAVEHTASVGELAALTGELVPGLEVLTVNQHLRMRSLDVQTPCPLFEHLPLPDVPLRQELRNFLERFAF